MNVFPNVIECSNSRCWKLNICWPVLSIGCISSHSNLIAHCSQNIYVFQREHDDTPSSCVNNIVGRDVVFKAEFCGIKLAKQVVLQCVNGASWNPVEGRTKIWQLKNLILPLFGLIFRRIYIYSTPSSCVNNIVGRDVVFKAEFCGIKLSTLDWNETKYLKVYGFSDYPCHAYSFVQYTTFISGIWMFFQMSLSVVIVVVESWIYVDLSKKLLAQEN
jgi:hypothetical protein